MAREVIDPPGIIDTEDLTAGFEIEAANVPTVDVGEWQDPEELLFTPAGVPDIDVPRKTQLFSTDFND